MYKETWKDNSKSEFKLYALSLSGRYYTKNMGRGFFAEANVGLARASVTTKENIQQEVKKQTFPLDFIGLGWRFGKRPKGIFREVGYRFNLALKYAHLYTTDHKPETKGLDNISYQSFE